MSHDQSPSGGNVLTSLQRFTSGQCFSRTFVGKSSISTCHFVSKKPVASSPNSKPPMPEKQLPICSFLFVNLGLSQKSPPETLRRGCLHVLQIAVQYDCFFRVHIPLRTPYRTGQVDFHLNDIQLKVCRNDEETSGCLRFG